MSKEGWLTLILRFAGGERRLSQPCVLDKGVLNLRRLPSVVSHLASRAAGDGKTATLPAAAASAGAGTTPYALSVSLRSCRVEDRRKGGGLEHFAILGKEGSDQELLFRAASDKEAEEWVVLLQTACADSGEGDGDGVGAAAASAVAATKSDQSEVFQAAEQLSHYPLVSRKEGGGEGGDDGDDDGEEEESDEEDSDEEEDSPFNFGLWQEGDSLAPFQTSDRSDVRRMLRMSGVGSGGGEGRKECVYDLGCGDGRIVIAAVAQFGADRAVGVEIDEKIAGKAKAAAEAAGVSDRVVIHAGDVLEYRSAGKDATSAVIAEEAEGVGAAGEGEGVGVGTGAASSSSQDALTDATVVVTFLLPAGMQALRQALRGVLARGGRVVSNTWGMGEGLRPVQEEDAENMSFYLYTKESLS